MDEIVVKMIIKQTIAEMKRQELLLDTEKVVYTEISERLHKYYDTEDDSDKDLRNALISIRNDKYYDIIPAFYRDGSTVEQIAELMEVDSRTISRNKKRLCLEIYTLLPT